MFKIIVVLIGCLAQQAVFPPTGFSPIGALSNGLPGISVSQTRSPTTYNTLNQTITFTITVSNPGTATLVGPITLSDAKLGTGLACGGNIAAGAMVTCSPNPTYSVTQADLDGGSFNVAVTATAAGSGLSATASTLTTTAVQNPSILLTKTPSTSTWNMVPTTINYTFAVKNTGNVTLPAAINITDPKTGGVSNCGGSGGLAPNLSKMCSASYTTAPGDSGMNIVNTAQAATTFGGMTYMDTKTATVTFSSGGPTIMLSTYYRPGQSCNGTADTTGSFQDALADVPNHWTPGGPPVILSIPNSTCAIYGTSSHNDAGACVIVTVPSNVSIEGSGPNSKILTTNYPDSGCSFFVLSLTWNQYDHGGYHNWPTFYLTGQALAGSNTISMNTSTDISNFTAGHYVVLYDRNPQVSMQGPNSSLQICDICPNQLNKIQSIGPGNLITMAHPWDRSFLVYIGAGYNVHPALADVDNQTIRNGGMKNLILEGADPININKVSDLTFQNVNIIVDPGVGSVSYPGAGSRTYNWYINSNAVNYTTFDNVNWDVNPLNGANGHIGGEWFQDNSSHWSWQNSHFGGNSTSNVFESLGFDELSKGVNVSNNSFFLYAGSMGGTAIGQHKEKMSYC